MWGLRQPGSASNQRFCRLGPQPEWLTCWYWWSTHWDLRRVRRGTIDQCGVPSQRFLCHGAARNQPMAPATLPPSKRNNAQASKRPSSRPGRTGDNAGPRPGHCTADPVWPSASGVEVQGSWAKDDPVVSSDPLQPRWGFGFRSYALPCLPWPKVCCCSSFPNLSPRTDPYPTQCLRLPQRIATIRDAELFFLPHSKRLELSLHAYKLLLPLNQLVDTDPSD